MIPVPSLQLKKAMDQKQNCSLTSFHVYNIHKRRNIVSSLELMFLDGGCLTVKIQKDIYVYRGPIFLSKDDLEH